MPLTPDVIVAAETPADRVRAALELCDLAERMLRQRLLREDPSIDDEQMEAAVAAWYADRPHDDHAALPYFHARPAARFAPRPTQ